MGLVELIEKLINEHGSAEIMEKRLVLFKEQVVAVEERSNKVQSENKRLKDELALALEEQDRLRAELAKHSSSGIDPTEEKLLAAVGLDRHGGMSAARLAGRLSIDPIRVEYFLGKLEKEGYIIGQHFLGGASLYSIGQRGREFLIKRGLV